MTPIAYFKKHAPKYMKRFMEDFPGVELEDVAAVFGNFGHECLGFTVLQQKGKKPPAGGYGWPQWDGERRKAYFEYCGKKGISPADMESNYAFVFYELKYTWEKRALTALKQAVGLENKVKAFEKAYERAGKKAYDERVKWARRALEAWKKSEYSSEGLTKTKEKSLDTRQIASGAVGAVIGGGATYSSGADWGLIALIAVSVGVVCLIVVRALK